MVEYIDQQINHLSWQISSKSSDIASSEGWGDCIISGSKTHISIWQFVGGPGVYDQSPIAEVASEKIASEACKVQLVGTFAFTALRNGDVHIHELINERSHMKSLRSLSEAKNLHKDYNCNDMLFCPQKNSILTCGDDGTIASFNIDRPEKISTKHVLESSLTCMDLVTPNEVICGTLSGALKHFDFRSCDCISTFNSQSLSTLTCIQRNPNVNHLATGGNDQGFILMYDLRNPSIAVAQVSAHDSSVTSVKYRPRDSGTLYSSSCDAELFRWNLNTELSANQLPWKVESISRIKEPLSITSLDINHSGDTMIYTSDHGAIFCQKLNDLVN